MTLNSDCFLQKALGNICMAVQKENIHAVHLQYSPMTLSLPSKCSFPDDPLGLIGAVMEPNGAGLAAVCCAAALGTSLRQAWGPLAAPGLSLWSPRAACLTEAAGTGPGVPSARPVRAALLLCGQQPRLWGASGAVGASMFTRMC